MKTSIFIFFLSLITYSYINGQCKIHFDKIENNNIFFRSNAFCDTVHCVVKVNLFYSQKNDPKKYSWSLLSVECKDMRFRKDDKLIVIQDKFKQHINDSIIKYIKQYYSSKHRLLTEFELVTISKYSSYKGVLKLVTTFSKVYIIPYKRELDL